MNKRLMILIAVAILVFLILPGIDPMKQKTYAKPIAHVSDTWGDHVKRLATKYGVPWRRVTAMIVNESWGNPSATGDAGERGLMQLKPGALSDVNTRYGLAFTFDQLYEPLANIEVGTAYLALMFRRFKDIDIATQAYNQGPGRIALDSTAGTAYLVRVKEIEGGIA